MCVAAVALGQAGVDLVVRNHTGANQVSAVVRGGVPFALGALRECAAIQHEIGNLYIGTFKHQCQSDKDGGHSELILLEDGKPLGPAHSAHANIRAEGKGRYSHWGPTQVWFATSDNSDPTRNGRQYKVVYRGTGK